MPPSTSKRVILYRFDRTPTEGLVDPSVFLANEGVEVLSLAGVLDVVPYGQVKAVCFSSSGGFDGSGRGELFSAYSLFERRPKVPGLWARFTFKDGDRLDGILSHNLLEWPEGGYALTPPRAGSARQRVFVPRLALRATEFRGVVGAAPPQKRNAGSQPLREDPDQLRMFDEELPKGS